MLNAVDRNRTGTKLPSRDFKSLASTYSTTTAYNCHLNKNVNKLVSLKGFEPITYGLEGRCSLQLSYRLICINKKYILCFAKQKRVMGIEPTLSVWKTGVLPLNYTRITGTAGFEPANAAVKVLCRTTWRYPHVAFL